MEIRLNFELVAVYPKADIHSQFCVITEPEVSKQLKIKMEKASHLTLPDTFVAKVLMEDGTTVCLYVDEYGISIMDEPAIHWWGVEEIKAPDYTVVFFHYQN